MNFPKNSLKKYAIILILNLFLLFLFFGCIAQPRIKPEPPRFQLVFPFEYLQSQPSTNFQKAYLDYQKGFHAKARFQFQKIIKKYPQHFPSQLAIVYTYLAEEQWDLAERHLEKVLQTAPDYPQAHFARSLVLEQKGQFDAALEELKEVRRIVPDYPQLDQNENILRLKATEYHLEQARRDSNKNPEEALQHYRIAQSLAPEVTQIPLEMATILLKQNRCEEARSYLEQARMESPEDQEARLHYALCLEEAQNLEKALEIYQELQIDQPESAELQESIKRVQERMAFLKMPKEFQSIPHTSQITRAQLASLIVTELDFLEKYSSTDAQIMTDTLNHWAKSYIQKTVDLGILEIFPNRTFQPDRPLTKLELALAASRLIEILQTSEGKKLPEPLESIFIPDVPGSNIYYPMIAKALSAHVISLDGDGRFHLNRPVSGAEAISMVNRVKSIAESS